MSETQRIMSTGSQMSEQALPSRDNWNKTLCDPPQRLSARKRYVNVAEIRSIARSNGIRPLPKSKLALVHAIQSREGNFPCFGTAREGVCDQLGCLWRADCFKLARAAGG